MGERRPGLMVLVCALATVPCSIVAAGRAVEPVIQADVVVAPAEKNPGAAEVRWDTGDGTPGEVYVSIDAGPEMPFARGPSGVRRAPWIRTGTVYDFRLYAAWNREQPLVTARVYVNPPPPVPPPRWLMLLGPLLLVVIGIRVALIDQRAPAITSAVAPSRWNDGVVLLVSVLAAGAFGLALGQDTNWDFRNYHFYNAYALITGRLHQDILPAGLQNYLNPLMDVPVFAVTTYCAGWVTGFLLAAFQGVTLFLLYKIASILICPDRPVYRRTIATAVAVTGFLGAANIGELGGTMGDNTVAVVVLAAVLAMVSHVSRVSSGGVSAQRGLLLAGVLVGAASGLKLTSLVFVVPALVAPLVALRGRAGRLRVIATVAAGMAAGFLLTGGGWSYFLFREFGNPVFPFFNGFFRSPYYLVDQNFADWRFMEQRTLLQHLRLAWNFAAGMSVPFEFAFPFRDARFLAAQIAVVAFAVSRACRGWRHEHASAAVNGRALSLLMLFTALSYVAWHWEFRIYRYGVIFEFLAPVLLAGILCECMAPKRAALVLVAACVLLVVWVQPLYWGRVAYAGKYVEAKVPAAVDLRDATVIMTGYGGTSYVIPFFPPSARWLRVESWMVTDPNRALWDARIRSALERHPSSPLFVMFERTDDVENAREAAARYGVMLQPRSCDTIRTNIGDGVVVCAARRVSQQ